MNSIKDEKNKDLPIKANGKNIITFKSGIKVLLPE